MQSPKNLTGRTESILRKLTLRQKLELCCGANQWNTQSFAELGLPALKMSDGTSGVRFQIESDQAESSSFFFNLMASFDTAEALERTYPATCFPSGAAIACSWDPSLLEQVGRAVATEAKALGIGLLLGPGLNTRRHPLAGRGFEYYSEDPTLTGELATGMVNGIQQEGVGACVKHFACNNADYKRTIMDSIVDERALREIYLAGFERVVKKARPAAVMGSYNRLNGVQACENHHLLTDILKNEWGFDGAVLSDWGAVKDPLAATRAGLDLQMPRSANATRILEQGLQSGRITEKMLDERCRRVIALALGCSRENKRADRPDLDAHHTLAIRAAAESAVLLKNEGALLPIDLNRVKKIAVLGDFAVHAQFQGTGCAIVHAQKVDTPLESIRQACATTANVTYAPGYLPDNSTTAEQIEEACRTAAAADIAVIFAGTVLPEENDTYNRTFMGIEPAHASLIEQVAAVQKNCVVVLCHGETVTMPWIDSVASVLDLWYAGEGCGQAAADLLFGKMNPCGRLPVTIPAREQDTPAFLTFPGENNRHLYAEGIFTGYRYYEKRQIAPLYPFGYGLSYTHFDYDNLEISIRPPEEEAICIVTFRVTNTGDRKGKEVPQLYISDGHSRLKRPCKELKAFCKISLRPGETKQVTFPLYPRDFSYYNPDMSDWVTDAGTFGLLVGTSSTDIRLRGTVFVPAHPGPQPLITPETHYLDIFQNKAASDVFFDFLVSGGYLTAQQAGQPARDAFCKAFWGIAQHLDMISDGAITPEMVDTLVARMNEVSDGRDK